MGALDGSGDGVCEHPLIQSQSPGGACIVPGCGKRKRGRPRKRMLLDAYAMGLRAAKHEAMENPPPFEAAPYNDHNGPCQPKRWRAPKDGDLPTPPAVLDADGILALLRKCDAELMKRSFPEFVRAAWHVVNPGETVVWGWHLEAICRHVQWAYEELFRVREARKAGTPLDEIRRQAVQNLMINVPPRSAKSLIVAVFGPVWAWLHDPTLKIRCTSGNLRVSDTCSDYAYDLITSAWFKETFTPTWQIRGDRTAKRKWANTAGGVRISMPMGAQVTGEGTDVIIVDDPHDAKDAYSEKKRNAVIDKWNRALRNRVEHPQHHLRICIMQRLHESDFAGAALSKGGWIQLCIPMEFEAASRCVTPMLDEQTGEPWTDPRSTPGQLMLPEYFDRAYVEHEKIEMGSYGFAGQMQQRPAPEDGGLFKKSWFIGEVGRPRGFDLTFDEKGKPSWATLPKIDQVFITIDAAFKETETSDFVSIQVIGRQGRMRYVLDNYTRRMDFVKTIAALRMMIERWTSGGKTISGILIEDKANGSAAVSMLQGAGVAGVIEINPEGGKFSRANAVAPACEAGDVMIPNHATWRESWLHELAVFPNGAHDDQVDAFTQALNYMRGSVDLARLIGSCKW